MTRARVLGYVRVSTAGQAQDGLSLAAQTERIRAHCVAQDLELVAVVEDAGVSASSLDRPGLTSALERIRAGGATGLVVTKLDRLTRSVRDLGVLIDGGAGTSWSLHSLGDHIDTTTASGRLVLNVLVSVSQWEREAASDRTRETLAHARAKGQHLGAIPFGWRLEKVARVDGKRVPGAPAGRLVAVPAEQATLVVMAMWRSNGYSLGAVAARLNAQGVAGARGGAWTATTVRRALDHRLQSESGGLVPARQRSSSARTSAS